MPDLIKLNCGDVIFIDEREHEFRNFVPAETQEPDAPDDLQFVDVLNGRIRPFTRLQFDELYLAGRLRWKTVRTLAPIDPPEISPKEAELRKVRHAFLTAFDAEPVPKTDPSLEALQEQVLKGLGGNSKHYKRHGATLRRWINGRGEEGARPLNCMGDRSRRGPHGTRMHPLALEILNIKAERYFADRNSKPKDVYVSVQTELNTVNDQRKLAGQGLVPKPSYPTIWRWLAHHTDYENTRRRDGARQADHRFTAIKGSLQANRILDLALMDHTWLDCHVVDDQHNLPCGRPYLTILIDLHSRMVLAYHLSFTPPSVETAMACIRKAVRPKHALSTLYPDVRGEMAFGVPREILVDNGWEFSGGSFKDACEDAGITVRWAPVRSPEYKGAVERFFRTLNQILIHKIKGAVPMPPHRLRELGVDPSADAVVLKSEIDELLFQACVEVYAREFHSGIKAVPQQVWRKGAEATGIEYAADLKSLDLSLSKLGPTRLLTRAGIEFQGLTFCSQEVGTLLRDMLPRSPKRQGLRVKFKYWPEDLSKIAVWNSTTQQYLELPCTDERYAADLSEHHHEIISKYARDEGLKFSSEDERCEARSRLNSKIELFVTARKIGDRRRAQRMVQARQETPVGGGGPDGSMAGLHLIETVENRAAGDNPTRNSVRKGKRAGRDGKRVARPVAPLQPEKPSIAIVVDPFAGFDRDALLNFERGWEHDER